MTELPLTIYTFKVTDINLPLKLKIECQLRTNHDRFLHSEYEYHN